MTKTEKTMSGSPEPQPIGNETAQIKAEVQVEIDAADTDVKKAQLVARLIQDLKDKETHAEEVVRDEAKIEAGKKLMPTKQAEAAQVFKSVIRAAEAAKKGIPVAKDNAQKLLTKLADQSLTPSTACAIEVNLLDYFTGKKNIRFSPSSQPKTDFEKDFDNLKAINPLAAELIAKSIIDNPTEFGLTEEQAKEKFEFKRQQISRDEETQIRQRSAKDEDEFLQLRKKISDAIQAAYTRNSTLTSSDPRYFTSDDNWKVLYFLGFHRDPQVERALNKLGISPIDIQRYIELSDQLFGKVDIRLYKQYAGGYSTILDRAEEEFDIKKFIEKGFIEREDLADGKVRYKFTREKRLDFQDLITKYYFEVLQEIHGDKSHFYQQKISEDMSFNYYFAGLRSIITNLCKDLADYHFADNDEVQKFLEDKKSRYQASIQVLGQTLHDLPLHARNLASFEKFPEFLQYLFPSQLAELFDDKDRFMQMARNEISSLIREKLVLKGNKYPANLRSGQYKDIGVRWSFDFEEELKDILVERQKELIRLEIISSNANLKDKKLEEAINLRLKNDKWKLDRAIAYASGLGIATLIDAEVESTADPNPNNFEEVDPMMAAVSIKHNWQGGRGDPIAGIIARYLLRTKVDIYPEARGLLRRLWKQKKWVPKEFADKVDRLVMTYGDKVLDQLFDREGSYQELLSMVNFATSLISRGGWRFRSLNDELIKNYKLETGNDKLGDLWKEHWNAKKWKELFDLSMADYGNASLWVFLTGGPDRLTTEMRTLLADRFGIDVTDEKFSKFSREDALKKIIDFIDKDGVKKPMNFFEIRQIREDQLRGETFFRQLRRNPGDFFMLLSQLAPEIGQDSVIFLPDDEWQSFYERKHLIKTKLEIERDKARRSELINRFGEEGFNTLIKVNQWVINSARGLNFIIKEGAQKGDPDTAEFVKALRRSSTTAYEKMMNRNEKIKAQIEEIRRKKPEEMSDDEKRTKIKALRDQIDPYASVADFGDDRADLAKSIYGDKGLIEILTGLKADELDDFYDKDNFGDYDKFGKDTIFYRMAHSWTIKQGNINPYASDFNYYAIYKHLGAVGESVQTRWLGDAAQSYKEIIKNIPNLEKVLLNIAESNNFEEIYKLHDALFDTLKQIIGEEYAFRANYILASIVTQFFWEHSLTRDPKLKMLLPASLLARLMIGKDISLSKILTKNRHAYSMDTNAARTYFMYLYTHHFIPKEGMWSFEQLGHAFDAKDDAYFAGDAAPTFIWFIVLYLLWAYIKKSIEEAEGKKK